MVVPPTHDMNGLGTRLGIVALQLALLSACVVQSAPPPPPPSPQVVIPAVQEPGPRSIQLEDGSYIEIKSGVEAGFTHCCGDSHFMMEVDCSDRLMRCYESARGRWKQTFGRHCKRALPPTCYLNTCDQVCEAISEFGRPR